MAVGQLDVDAGVVLRDAGHLAFAIDRYGQLFDPAGQEAFDMFLAKSEPVVVPGRKIADVQRDVGEAAYLHCLALREKAIRDSTLIENLDRAGVQATRTRANQLRGCAPLDNRDVDARQHEFARQHHPGRTSSGNHHRMFGHRHPLVDISGTPTPASNSAASGGTHTRTSAPNVGSCTASRTIGSTSPRDPYVNNPHIFVSPLRKFSLRESIMRQRDGLAASPRQRSILGVARVLSLGLSALDLQALCEAICDSSSNLTDGAFI